MPAKESEIDRSGAKGPTESQMRRTAEASHVDARSRRCIVGETPPLPGVRGPIGTPPSDLSFRIVPQRPPAIPFSS